MRLAHRCFSDSASPPLAPLLSFLTHSATWGLSRHRRIVGNHTLFACRCRLILLVGERAGQCSSFVIVGLPRDERTATDRNRLRDRRGSMSTGGGGGGRSSSSSSSYRSVGRPSERSDNEHKQRGLSNAYIRMRFKLGPPRRRPKGRQTNAGDDLAAKDDNDGMESKPTDRQAVHSTTASNSKPGTSPVVFSLCRREHRLLSPARKRHLLQLVHYVRIIRRRCLLPEHLSPSSVTCRSVSIASAQ
jgi:hypothetical protein